MYYYDENDGKIHAPNGVALTGSMLLRHLNNMLEALGVCGEALELLRSVFAPDIEEIVPDEIVMTEEKADEGD
jgi:hypothetical protein